MKGELPRELIEFARQRYGFSDEQIRQLSPTQWRHIKAHPRREQYRIVAEVVKAENCAHKPKVGDKFVLRAGGTVVPQETTFPALCVWALAPLLPFIHIVYDRIADGLEDPSPQGWDHVHCADVGAEGGGMGRVLFKVYCEKV